MLVAQRLCDNLNLKDRAKGPCGNAGRYLTADGDTFCSLCAMQSGKTAVRFADMPRIIRVIEAIAAVGTVTEDELALFRSLLPRKF